MPGKGSTTRRTTKFLTPTPHHIRFVAAPPEGGESTGGTGQPPASAGTENAGDPIDWEAKYKEALGHSRDWEKKAKANKAAADELEKLKESQMSETEKAAKRTQELEAQVAAYKAKEQQADWKAQVSADTGVPADVIPKPKAPAVHGADRQPSGKGPNESMVNYLRNLGL